MQQESLEKLLQFGCSKKNKVTTFAISKNFVAPLESQNPAKIFLNQNLKASI